MSDKKRPTLEPQYMKSFRCIGPACEDSCCIGWLVFIDRQTYLNYRKIRDPELAPIFHDYLVRSRASDRSNLNFAKLKMKEDGSCPLLIEDGLCRIHSKLGEDYLSYVCATYPRFANIVNSVLERSATMSCPEAARLALLDPAPMRFDQGEELVEARSLVMKLVETHDPAKGGDPVKYLRELRVFVISLLQNRNYAVWERMIVLGLFCKKLQELVENRRIDDIPDLVYHYGKLIEERASLKNGLAAIEPKHSIQMELLKEIADKRYYKGIASRRYLECLTEFLKGIQYTSETRVEEIGERYNAAYQEHYRPFMDRHEYILENYMVNHVFRHLFPGNDNRSLFDSYMMLVLHYALIKMHLIGIAAHHKGLTPELVIKLIQSLAKTVEHNQQYLDEIAGLMRENRYNTMGYMAILIKN